MSIRELTPAEALDRFRAGAFLVDVRAEHERALGTAEGARGVERAQLEGAPASHFPAFDAEIVLICQSGTRSQLVAQALQSQGYRNVASVAGGTSAWVAAGLPMIRPQLDADFSERYSRHLRLPEVGLEGQKKLEAARMLLVGAGGLGSPSAFYLAAAGIGTLPPTLLHAIEAFEADPLVEQVFGAEFRDLYATLRRREWEEVFYHVSDWQRARDLDFL
jgi:rhodanese-related sulfurtransferase